MQHVGALHALSAVVVINLHILIIELHIFCRNNLNHKKYLYIGCFDDVSITSVATPSNLPL